MKRDVPFGYLYVKVSVVAEEALLDECELPKTLCAFMQYFSLDILQV